MSSGTVHPHVHGERSKVAIVKSCAPGSSPRTWGTPSGAGLIPNQLRFIPTYMGNAGRGSISFSVLAVHPHVHGERSNMVVHVLALYGSSPRTWGTRALDRLQTTHRRFIPTYMGNALSQSRTTTSPPVHPHVHGERALPLGAVLYVFGSSPRTWGTLPTDPIDHLVARFIPTYMGNAASRKRPKARGSVHPHVHGERSTNAPARPFPDGSSPRTWGTPLDNKFGWSRRRFIPTYMGNASVRPFPTSGAPVHPHVHGERVVFRGVRLTDFGSSPRTWGTPTANKRGARRYRFIPTYMGNASAARIAAPPRPVHPHVHGERFDLLLIDAHLHGSSPRTWGTLTTDTHFLLRARFIPTYMGNAYPLQFYNTRLPVHPHVHGERLWQTTRNVFPGGSSPRTWGTHTCSRSIASCCRFIPTYMGNAILSYPKCQVDTVHPHVHGERNAPIVA